MSGAKYFPSDISKRDGRREPFDFSKVFQAISCAFDNTQERCINKWDLVELVGIKLDKHPSREWSVEDVQDVVEKTLMEEGYFETAKHYILYRQKRAEERNKYGIALKNVKHIDIPWGEIGYITYKRTYARRLNEDDNEDERTEEYDDTIMRVLGACQTQLGVGFTREELEQAREMFLKLKCSVAGRFLWQLGTKTVDRLGLASTQNCAFVVVDSPVRPFTWTFDMLMLGSGVGFNIQRKFVDKIPPIMDINVVVKRQDTKDADFIVPDSREGWVCLLRNTLEAFFVTGESFTYSTILIRSKGTPIKGFGGVSSGAEHLCKGIQNICDVVRKRRGQKMRPIDCLDVMNIIATIVVSGNVRRAAQISLGDPDDVEYLRAKRWDLGNIPNWRAMSNNSVICSDIDELDEEFWNGYRGNGEPYGLINLELSKSTGRILDGTKYPDPLVEGCNPCSEQHLANFETCCLSEIFLPNIDSFDELVQVSKVLYRICKHSLDLKCHHGETQQIVHQNMRMGIGITGYLMVSEEKKRWLPRLYDCLREFDCEYSKAHGFNTSIKLTTVKPSGTLSLLSGSTPGCHPAIYRHFIRRIRMSADNPLVQLCKNHGYKVEYQINFDGSLDYTTCVVEFPCKFPEDATFAKNMNAIQELEVVKRLQTEWSDNAVSVTCYYRLEELDAIKEWLRDNYTKNIKSVSFLLHYESGFKQMPYEEITEEHYHHLKSHTTPITRMCNMSIVDGIEDNTECRGGMCPIK